MKDLISREDAIKEAYTITVDGESFDVVQVETLEGLPSAQPEQQHGRIFQEIVVRYPSYNPYPEYQGKPYFSIKYTKNGQEFIGYSTYKPEVLSEYLKEYFMPSAQPEPHEIGYSECANSMLKMWIDNVLTDGEYNHIMDRLNAHHNAGRRRAESEDKE